MIIKDLITEKREDKAVVAATVAWENCNRATEEIYFATDEGFADSLSCNPNAFLVACIVPAMAYGEERVAIDAEICPELRNSMITALSWLRHWFYDPERKLPQIEAKAMSDIRRPRTPERAGFFFSGGIDSFATLRVNRLSFPPEHPWSIKDGILVYGLELDRPDSFNYVTNLLSEAAPQIGVTLIPVYTNIYLNYRAEDAKNDWDFWMYKFQGSALAAVAHALARRLTVVSIAASDDLYHLLPYGSHPSLDPNYSSIDLRIRHDGVNYTRFEKTKLIAEWDAALKNLRVCNRFQLYESGKLNCGKCEKCVRTMLALIAAGALEKTDVFPEHNVTTELVHAATRGIHSDLVQYYEEFIPALVEKGRHDLVKAIQHNLKKYYRRHSRHWWPKIRHTV